jgi:hypothetical protein
MGWMTYVIFYGENMCLKFPFWVHKTLEWAGAFSDVSKRAFTFMVVCPGLKFGICLLLAQNVEKTNHEKRSM